MQPTRTLHTGGRLPVRDFFGGQRSELNFERCPPKKSRTGSRPPVCKVRVGFARTTAVATPHRGGHRDPPWEHRRSPLTARHGPPRPIPTHHAPWGCPGWPGHARVGRWWPVAASPCRRGSRWWWCPWPPRTPPRTPSPTTTKHPHEAVPMHCPLT